MFALYTKTEYSMLNNTIHITDLVKRCKEYGYKALSITDNNMHGVYKFYSLCRENNIIPIIGLEAKIESRVNVTGTNILYAINNKGYHNLLLLCSEMNINSFISLPFLKEHNEGIIMVSTDKGDINYLLRRGKKQEAITEAKYFSQIVEYYIGLEPQLIDFEEIGQDLVWVANTNGLYVLPLSQTLYMDYSDQIIHSYLRAISLNKPISEIRDLGGTYHFKNPQELEKEFMGYSYAFDNLDRILETIDVSIEKTANILPVYPSNSELSSVEYLNELCKLGLKKRYEKIQRNYKSYENRLNYELDIISKMGFSDYFLIVYDFVKYAKKKDIYVGPGRGSAAGSLVAYCLGITDVDPLKYNLFFERFLNPERITMPDIDMDFPHNRRREVIDYVISKYGKNNVCHIVTFDTFKARGALRDIAKAMEVPSSKLEELMKHVGVSEDLSDISQNKYLMMMREDDEINSLINIAKHLDGLPRHTGTHAAGVIISNDEITVNSPIMRDSDGYYISQYEASDLEHLGLLKIDFLGLKNLTMIDDVVSSVRKNTNIKIDIRNIPLDDEKTFQFLSSGKTTGIFQLESEGIRKVIKKMKPSSFQDIVALLALYRPGPMDNIDIYIERRNGHKFTYLHPILEPILKDTYGIIIYQEQIMQIANVYANYSLGEADVLRRAVSKKDAQILLMERKKFCKRVKENGFDESVGNTIYDYIVKFANYGFNKSHSVAYGLVCYQTAFLKANYPLFFMNELLNNVIGDSTKTKNYILEARSFGISILGPSIFKSELLYKIEDNAIRYPILGIKNVGSEIGKNILELRKNNQLSYFEIRKSLSPRALESLVYVGALDELNMTKKKMINMVHDDLNYQAFLSEDELINNDEFSLTEMVVFEKECLGFNLKYNPLDTYINFMKEHDYVPLSFDLANFIGREKNVIGFISKIKEIRTKNNEKMAFFLASNGIIEMEGFVFPSNYKDMDKITLNKVYSMRVKAVYRNNVLQFELIRLGKGVTLL